MGWANRLELNKKCLDLAGQNVSRMQQAVTMQTFNWKYLNSESWLSIKEFTMVIRASLDNYLASIRALNKEKLMQLLTYHILEEAIQRRVETKAKTYGQVVSVGSFETGSGVQDHPKRKKTWRMITLISIVGCSYAIGLTSSRTRKFRRQRETLVNELKKTAKSTVNIEGQA
ncbi:Chorismate mutase, AroQ class, eukaryotic type [Artemisia annua]|uniref:chorismate mutase n=1 Tax=Artemisia annua TaxID=35608 RepID=A0A2U1QAF8_ARTAN|nr:Chorismate mutase, AroQ class, eukaryotic type [Artemisia annua]